MLEDAYTKGRQQREQVRRDMEIGKERAKQDGERVKAEAEAERGTGDRLTDRPAAYSPSR
jgi:hypothetical protein